MSFLMHVVAHVPHYLEFDTMLPFHALSYHVVAYIVSFEWDEKI